MIEATSCKQCQWRNEEIERRKRKRERSGEEGGGGETLRTAPCPRANVGCSTSRFQTLRLASRRWATYLITGEYTEAPPPNFNVHSLVLRNNVIRRNRVTFSLTRVYPLMSLQVRALRVDFGTTCKREQGIRSEVKIRSAVVIIKS